MDKRIDYKIVLDTETCPVDKTISDVNPNNMLVYDIGWVITDKHGNIYGRKSYLIAEIFLGEKELMKSAYYASKIPDYWKKVKSGETTLTSYWNIRRELVNDMANYNVTRIFAHNMYFDLNSLNKTADWISKSKYKTFFPKGAEICCTLKMSRSVVSKTPSYKKFCADNGFLTANGQARLTAEVLYRFIKQDLGFIESHTALEDALIETQIMAYCYGKKKKMNRLLFDKP